MPNIEVHGRFNNPDGSFTEAYTIWCEVVRRVARLPFHKDAVVTKCDCTCQGWNDQDEFGIEMPFIRICATKRSQIDDLISFLSGIADIEILPLQEFIPKR